MKLKTQLNLCITGSAVLTLITLILTVVFADDGWFSFGPSSRLIIAGVVIDTPKKYSVLVVIVVLNSVM